MPIRYVETPPVSALDENGIGLVVRSGDDNLRFRFPRSAWRKFLETELRKLNEWEVAERMDRGRVIPMERKRGH